MHNFLQVCASKSVY